MKQILIFILGIFMFSSLVSYSTEVYETASADFMSIRGTQKIILTGFDRVESQSKY